jgi:hypothetical protein
MIDTVGRTVVHLRCGEGERHGTVVPQGTSHHSAVDPATVLSGQPRELAVSDSGTCAGKTKECLVTESDRGSAASDSTSIFAGGLFGSAEAETSEDVVGLEGLSAGSALLVVKRGPNAGSRFQLDRDKITAGRHPESDIFLDDVTVSRRHAEFRRTAEGFEVADIGSLNGTYVNREPIEVSTLSNGDEVQIGKFRLVFLSGDQAEGDTGS